MLRFVLLLACATSLFSASLDPAQLPANRQWVAHLDVRLLLDGNIGAYLRQRLIDDGHQLKVQQFSVISGIDPLRDIDTVTLAGIDDQSGSVMCWVRGRFDAKRLNELAILAEQHQTSTYREYTIHSWVDANKGNRPQAGCVVSSELIIFGENLTTVQAALDVLAGTSPGLAADAALVLALPTQPAPILLAAAGGGDGWKGRGGRSAFVQQVSSIGLSATEQNQRLILSANAIATDATVATKLRDMGQGLLALAAFNQEIQQFPVLAQAVQSAQISTDGAKVHATVSCDLEALRAAADAKKAGR